MSLYRLLANFGISAGSFERIGLCGDEEVHAENAKRKENAENAKESILLNLSANSARYFFTLREKKELV